MDCSHPNRIITEYLSGKAVHRWKDGTYDYSVEVIERDRIVEECPDCTYRLTLTKGMDMPEDVHERLLEARKMVDTAIDPRDLQ